MIRTIRLFLFLEGAAFIAAALTHLGLLMHGYEHRKAGTAESVIGLVLLLGWAWSWLRPRSTGGIGLAVQAFALLGTLVGIFTIAIGIGPRTAPDLAFHTAIVVVLVSGLIATARARAPGTRAAGDAPSASAGGAFPNGEAGATGSRRSAGIS